MKLNFIINKEINLQCFLKSKKDKKKQLIIIQRRFLSSRKIQRKSN